LPSPACILPENSKGERRALLGGASAGARFRCRESESNRHGAYTRGVLGPNQKASPWTAKGAIGRKLTHLVRMQARRSHGSPLPLGWFWHKRGQALQAGIDCWRPLAYYYGLETLMRQASRASRNDIWQILMRSAATLLLVLIVADLADASCDPSGIPAVSLDTSPSRAAAGDACGTVCFPDCFCCSTLGPALPIVSLLTTESISEAPAPPVYRPKTGISPTLDHVPLASL